MKALKILLISSALPRDTTAGEVLLYRHFSQFPDLKLAIASDNLESVVAETLLEVKANRLLNRLTITRFSRWVHDICQCIHPFFNYHILRNYIKSHKPNLIVTVAEGIHWIAAQKMSQEFDIPLVTIFHDWWPDLASIHSWAKQILNNHFKQLYQQSTLAFCVSEGMRQSLGNHPNAEILYPIPDCPLTVAEERKKNSDQKIFKLVYAGSISGIYAPMIQQLLAALHGVKELQLNLFGRLPNCQDDLLQEIKRQGVHGGFLPRDLLRQELNQASALLVTISFDPNNRRWAETSFPSKLVEYCQYNKPIIIWGPDYCSAVRWGLKYQSALIVTSPLAQNVVQAIQALVTRPEEQTRLKKKTIQIAQEMFNPEKIQEKFINKVYEAATSPI